MPKMKTHRAAAKRYKVTGTGKITLCPDTTHQTMDGFGYAITYSTCYNLLKMKARDRHRFLINTFSPTVGGVERYTFNLAKRAAAAGHRALVVTSALPGLPAHEVDEHGIEVFRLPVWPVMKGRFPVCKPFSPMMREVWAQRPDFCVVQTKMYVQSVWAAVAV